MTVLGSSEGTNIFLKWTNISFLKFICGILNRGVANSFWNHVIKISSRQMYFQDINSNLWKVKVFSGNIYSFKSNTYFWGTVMFVQDGFLYLIVTRHKLTVQFFVIQTKNRGWPTGFRKTTKSTKLKRLRIAEMQTVIRTSRKLESFLFETAQNFEVFSNNQNWN
jgi:hypothetical protein